MGIPSIRHHGTGRDGDVVETGDRSRIELTRCPGLDEPSLHLAVALRRPGEYKHLLNASSDVHDLNEASNDTKYHTNDVSTHRREPKRPPLQTSHSQSDCSSRCAPVVKSRKMASNTACRTLQRLMSSARSSISTSLPFSGLQAASGGIREGFAATGLSQTAAHAIHESRSIHTRASPLCTQMTTAVADRGGRGFHCSSWSMQPESDESRSAPEASEKVMELADRIIELNMLEVSSLTEVLKDRLGISGASGMMMMPGAMMPGAGGAGAGAAAAPGAPEAAAEEKKDDFAVKLTGYDAASKIKVIKEVRAVTDLGLKEAKEMVEKGEFVVKEGLGKEEAEALVKKLEEVGGQVKME